MAINPLKLRPTEVLRLLNSTSIGTVAGDDCVFLAIKNLSHVEGIVQKLTSLLD